MEALLSMMKRLEVSETSLATETPNKSSSSATNAGNVTEQQNSNREAFQRLISVMHQQADYIDREAAKFFIGLRTVRTESQFNGLIVSFLNKSDALMNTLELICDPKLNSNTLLCTEFTAHYSRFSKTFCHALLNILQIMLKETGKNSEQDVNETECWKIELNGDSEKKLLIAIGGLQETCKQVRLLPKSNSAAVVRRVLQSCKVARDTIREFNEMLEVSGSQSMEVCDELQNHEAESDGSDGFDFETEELSEKERPVISEFIGFTGQLLETVKATKEALINASTHEPAISVDALNQITQIVTSLDSKFNELAVLLYPPIDFEEAFNVQVTSSKDLVLEDIQQLKTYIVSLSNTTVH